MTDSKKALIVGASRGIGLGVVDVLAKRGWQVTATTRAAVPEKSPAAVEWVTLDINQSAAREAVKNTLSAHHFDLIFINAGVFGPDHQDIHQASDEEIIQLLLTNAISPVRTAAEFIPLLNHRTGVLALMTSELSSLNENEIATYPLYSASKAALNMLTRGLQEATEKQELTLLSIHPGWVKTDMGGENATLTVEESATGIVDQFDAYRGKGGHHFVEYSGRKLRW
ncbi:SDR family oxidoreductase [Pantoea coffeiphila]|uniref:Short-chain dehydrogenase n=1 Tax=Pantoea coffeiphila TaxID=1465635 RepID=A0A2S9I671_9GAMM|nr:SDR family oxidoreductase [Pantoea coffeiphila]PRD13280.1 short-chain dehydrogenase [Pantoea coffeiphila]